jgi:hypothetical protein
MTKFLGVLKGDVSVAEVPTVNPDQGGKKKRRNYFSVLRMKGDVEGHPFRGNQWTDGSGGGDSSGEVGQRWNPPKDARSVAESGEVKVFSYGFDGEGSALTVVRGDKVIATGFSDDGGPAVNQPFVNGKSQGVKSFDSVKDMAEHFASLHSAKANPGKVSSKLNSLSSKLHDKIPLQDAFDAAEANGYEPVQEDGTRWQGILTGREGRAEIDLKDRKSGKIANRMQIQWYRHENTGRYEFNAYLSGNPSRKGEYSSILKGDFEGHPFRGNQYTDGEGGDGESKGYGKVFSSVNDYGDGQKLSSPPKAGDKVAFGFGQRTVTGTVVRVDNNPAGGYSPFAVVDHGMYESTKVPLQNLRVPIDHPPGDLGDDPEGPAPRPNPEARESTSSEKPYDVNEHQPVPVTNAAQMYHDWKEKNRPPLIPRTSGMNGKLEFTPIKGGDKGPGNGEFTIRPARYAKGKALVQAPSGDGYKTRASRLAEAVGGKYTGREDGYTMSPKQAERFHQHYQAGDDANSFTREIDYKWKRKS